MPRYEVRPTGWVESPLKDRAQAPIDGTPILDLKPVLDPAAER